MKSIADIVDRQFAREVVSIIGIDRNDFSYLDFLERAALQNRNGNDPATAATAILADIGCVPEK